MFGATRIYIFNGKLPVIWRGLKERAISVESFVAVTSDDNSSSLL
jgi:hypothetical protein